MENLIEKYTSSTLTKEELTLLKEWLKEKENQNLFENITKEKYHISLLYNNQVHTKKAFDKVQQRINPLKKSTLINTSFLKYAAILIISLSSIFFFKNYILPETTPILDTTNQIVLTLKDGSTYNLSSMKNGPIKNKQGQLIANISEGKLIYNESRNSAPATFHTISVPNTKVYKLVLADGTLVTINSGSSLKYLNHFNTHPTRKVFLKGEAFFDVRKNTQAPFTVSTRGMNIKVLGTRFNVSSYTNDSNASVVLEEGSVSIENKLIQTNEAVVLKPNEQVVLEQNKLKVKTAVVAKHIAWKKRKLHFSNDKFEEIVKEMERYYNVKITLNSSTLNNKRFTGAFTSESIEEVLNVFKELSNFKYTYTGNSIAIFSIK